MRISFYKSTKLPAAVCFGTFILAVFYEAWFYFSPLPSFPSPYNNIEQIRASINTADFCFAVAGDNRNDLGVFPSILQHIDSDQEIAFMVHTGDLVMAPRPVFFHQVVNTIKDHLHKPFLIVPGNHDVQGKLWGNPGTSFYEKIFGPSHLKFMLGSSRFVMLDSNHLRVTPEDERKWLRNALSTSDHCPVLIFMHVPLSDPRGKEFHHGLKAALSRDLIGIFKETNVNHVYSGHIHGYWSGNINDIPYTIAAGGGAWLYSKDPEHGFYHYIKVRVKDGRITQEVVRVKRNLIAGLFSYLYYSNLTGFELLFIILFLCSCGLCIYRQKKYRLLTHRNNSC